MKKVEIYSLPTCPPCLATKAFFKENGIEFTDYDVAEDQERAREMFERSGLMSTPVIYVDGKMVSGFDKEKLMELLDIK